MSARRITAENITDALLRVERGEAGIDDANLLRNYIAALEALAAEAIEPTGE
jgi:hypothetical protein